MQFSGINCIHIFVQPSLPSISRIFLSQIETLCPLNNNTPLLSAPAPGMSPLGFDSASYSNILI